MHCVLSLGPLAQHVKRKTIERPSECVIKLRKSLFIAANSPTQERVLNFSRVHGAGAAPDQAAGVLFIPYSLLTKRKFQKLDEDVVQLFWKEL